MRQFLTRLSHLLHRRSREAELREEMELHRAMKQRELEERGVTPSEARLRVQRQVGSMALASDRSRDVWIAPGLQDVGRDFRFAFRLIRKEPSFAAIIAIVLGLGIGIASLQYVLIDAICLRGLPIPGVDRVLFLGARDSAGRPVSLSFREVDRIATAVNGISPVGAFTSAPVALGDEGRAPERALATYVSPPLLALIGERPWIGRDFEPADDRPGAAPVVMLTAAVWQARYAGDRSIVGRTVRINGHLATVIGVTRSGFRFPALTDLWLPLTALRGVASDRQTARLLDAIVRAPDAGTLAGVRTRVASEADHLAREYPATNAGIAFTAVPINDRYHGRLTDTVWLTFIGAAAIVLLISCANAANLLLIRAGRRGHEMAVRASLGASRARIVRQLVIESAVLAALGASFGAFLSVTGLRIVNRIVPDNTLPYWMTYTMDARGLMALCAISVTTVFLFGLAPAVHVARTDVSGAIKTGGPAATALMRSRRWMTLLLGAETGLSIVMLVALVVGFRAARVAERQFVPVNPENVLTTWIAPSGDRYTSPDARRALYRDILDQVQGIAGSRVIAAVATALPLGGGATRPVTIEGQPVAPAQTPPTVWTLLISPRYFDALGVTLLRGRPFSERDSLPESRTAIVNQRFASMFFSNGEAIGGRFRLDGGHVADDTSVLTIVGVAPTIRQRALPDPDPIVYLPLAARPPASAVLLVRGASNVAASAPDIREAVRGVDADLPLSRVMPLAQAVDEARWNARVSQLLANAILVVSIALVVVGFYAVMSHAVAQRTREIGIRMALGARRRQVVRMVARRALLQLAFGVAAGVACTFAFNRLVNLGGGQGGAGFGVYWFTDPITLATVIGALSLVTIAASIAPAWRASRVDPLAAMRCD